MGNWWWSILLLFHLIYVGKVCVFTMAAKKGFRKQQRQEMDPLFP